MIEKAQHKNGMSVAGHVSQKNNVMDGSCGLSHLQSLTLSTRVLKYYVFTVGEKCREQYIQNTTDQTKKSNQLQQTTVSFISNACGRRLAGITEVLTISGIPKTFRV